MSVLGDAYSAVVVLPHKVSKTVFYSLEFFGILNTMNFLT